MTVITACRSKHYRCVSTEWSHTWSLKSTRWMNRRVPLFDMWYYHPDIFIIPPFENLEAQFCCSHTQDQPAGLEMAAGLFISRQKPHEDAQTFVDWDSTCFWQGPSPNHLAFESLLPPTCTVQPSTSCELPPLTLATRISLRASKHTDSMSSSLKTLNRLTRYYATQRGKKKQSCSRSNASRLWPPGKQKVQHVQAASSANVCHLLCPSCQPTAGFQ